MTLRRRNDNLNMPLEISEFRITKRTEKQRIHEFKKWMLHRDILLPPYNYDPYPNAKPDEVVEQEPIGHEIIIEVECISNQPLNIGQSFTAEQRAFAITRLAQTPLPDGKMKCVLTASHFETFIEPAKLAMVIRKKHEQKAKELGDARRAQEDQND